MTPAAIEIVTVESAAAEVWNQARRGAWATRRCAILNRVYALSSN